jgi:hypothetical protein
MPKYPNSTLTHNRLCGIFLGRACPKSPCKHCESQDPDALEEWEECLAFPGSNSKLWEAWRSTKNGQSSGLKNEMLANEWGWYEARFPRCERINEKRETGVYKAEQAELKRVMEEAGVDW